MWPFNRHHGEWAYGGVKPCLFVEEFLPDDGSGLADINIRFGSGNFGYGSLTVFTKTPRQSVIYLDHDGTRIGHKTGPGVTTAELDRIPVPDVYPQAMRHAEALSRDVDYARFDFLVSGGKLYGGEITVYPASGYGKLPPSDSTAPGGPADLQRMLDRAWNWRRSWFFSAPLTGWRAAYRQLLMRLAFGEETGGMQDLDSGKGDANTLASGSR